MSRNFTVERIREIAGHSRESITLYTNYFYTVEGLDGISECKTFEEVVEYKMPDFGKLDKLNQPLVFRRRHITNGKIFRNTKKTNCG